MFYPHEHQTQIRTTPLKSGYWHLLGNFKKHIISTPTLQPTESQLLLVRWKSVYFF